MLKLYAKAQGALRSLREESGQDVIEYALIGAFISVVAATLITSVGNSVVTLFGDITTAL